MAHTANRRHRTPNLVALLILPLLVALGFWQLDRASEKRELQDEYDRRIHDSPIRVTGKLRSLQALRFYRVTVTGHYDTDYQILIDNRVNNGKAGYHVLTPLKIEGSDVRILINRGWVAQGPSRQQLPKIDSTSDTVVVTGLATVPLKGGYRLGPPDRTDSAWYPVWQYLDLNRYRLRVPFRMQPVVVLMDPKSGAGGFVRNWHRLDTGIAVHQGYAFQWFSLAVALVALVMFFNFRGSPAKNTHGDIG